jgi:rare lipoprotein A
VGLQLDINRAFAVAVFVAASCAGHIPPPPPLRAPDSPAGASPTGSAQPEAPAPESGFATYYARRFIGRKTASGDRYNPSLLTAAHRTLPFGTMVEVRRSDGRRVVVRINDRGPFGNSALVIDLSRRAAEELGIVHEGRARVELRPISPPP